MKINIQVLLFRLLLLFTLTTIFQVYLDAINKILFGVSMVLLLFLILNKKAIYKEMLIFILLIIFHVFALFFTEFPLYNLNDLFYFVFWVLYSLYVVKNQESIIKYLLNDKKFIINLIRVWNLIVLISIPLPSSYKIDWGGERYFTSFAENIFRLAPTALGIMTLVLFAMIAYKRKRHIIYTILPMFCFYMGGSRTYLGVGLLMFIIIWYIFCPKRSMFYLTIVPIAFLAVSLIAYSATQSKILATSYTSNSYYDFWGTVTSGRSVFWRADLEAYLNSGIIHQLFGNGFNFVYDVNARITGSYIWAHNDFIQILTTFGLLGLLLYLYSIKAVFRGLLYRLQIPFLLKILIFVIWGFNAFFNMFYTYFCSMISLPLLMVIVNYSYNLHLQDLKLSYE
ncbi:O-antigen ligase family protein [Desulfosporosinus sp. SB140]|uniref:O-antigen ligase family protein n=1 Tax=Desulfosporosinus paludis TaxID=3115649 RepID=UPI00388FD24B